MQASPLHAPGRLRDTDEAKTVLLWEREQFFAYADALQAVAGDEAAAETLRLKNAELCCVIHTCPAIAKASCAASLGQEACAFFELPG